MTALPRPRKRFGQHFLEPVWVSKLIEAVAPRPGDTFLEIGPGRGALTVPLAERVHRLVAVEIDRDLAATLAARVPPHVTIIEGDILDLDLRSLLTGEPKPVRVVGNLPYNISSPTLFKLLASSEEGRLITDATIMLQKEVADRLTAPPGSRRYGALAIQVALVADVDRLLLLPPRAFRPPPNVTSTLVRLRFRPALEDVGSRSVFERLVRGLFLHRRKTLVNALKPVAHSLNRAAPELLACAGLEADRRPETLTVADFARLSRAVNECRPLSGAGANPTDRYER